MRSATSCSSSVDDPEHHLHPRRQGEEIRHALRDDHAALARRFDAKRYPSSMSSASGLAKTSPATA